MVLVDPNYKKKIQEQLIRSGALQNKCPRCGNTKFQIFDDIYTVENETNIIYSMNMFKQSLPYLVVACSKCGFMSFHSVNILESNLGK